MDTNYFLTNDVSKWCLRTAFQSQEEKTPNLSIRHVLQALKSDVKAAAKSEEPERAKAAEDLLHNWRTVKSSLMLRRDKKQKPMLKNVTGSITVMNASGPITLHYNDNRGSSSSTSPAITVPAKRSVQEEEGNSTPEGSWDSAEKNKRRKYLNVYLSSSFGETDFGDDEDTSPKWVVDGENLTARLREYRQKAVKGALMRKDLSNAHILSLSYIFLLSLTERCVLSRMSRGQKMSVMNSLNVIDSLEFLDDDAIIACRRMQLLVDDKSRSVNDCEDEIHLIKSNSTNHNVKLAAKVIVSIIHLLRQSTSDVRQEATLIIEALRPFIHNTIVLPTDGAKMEWMTYHVLPPSGYRHCQAMAPDFVLYVDPLSTINFELFFVEVKRKGNFGNGHLESDIVKLGKEMQIGLTKLVQYKVECPEVVGLLIEDGSKATAYRMDLLYNGQYRMVELSNFHFIRQTPDDILLVPTILEKLQQLQKIISRTMTKLYKAVNGEQEEVLEEKLSYIRDA